MEDCECAYRKECDEADAFHFSDSRGAICASSASVTMLVYGHDPV